MTLRRLIVREISHRRLNFILGLISVLVAVGVLIAQMTLLGAYDIQTTRLLDAKRAELEKEMARMQDDYRQIMKKLGFNLLILPASQDLVAFHIEGCADHDLPEQYVTMLADSGIMTIRHLLPSIEQKIQWPEQNDRTIILAGTRGEVPLTHRQPKEPMMLAVPPETAVVGHVIAQDLGLEVGRTFTLLDKQFTVGLIHPERGNRDDATIWIDLAQAQHMLHKEGRINAILALKCHCAGAELSNLRQEIGLTLPGVQVIEVDSKIVVRSEARDRADVTAVQMLETESQNRASLRSQRETLAAWLTPAVTITAALLIALLTFTNVRERTAEIGILRAIGFRSLQIIMIFLIRAVLIGFTGAVLGYMAGYFVGLIFGEVEIESYVFAELFDVKWLVAVIIIAPLITIIVSWIPALVAAGRDPAVVLRED